MTIGIVTTKDPSLNRRVWSGTVYKSREAIESLGYNIKYIPIKKDIWVYMYYFMYKVVTFLLHKRSNPLYSVFVSKRYGHYLKTVDLSGVDVLFVPAMSPYIAFFETDIPIIYLTDSTFKLYCDYYPLMTNLCTKNQKEGYELDLLTYKKAAHVICSSKWAYNSIVNDFNINSEKVSVLEFGPNIDENTLHVKPFKRQSSINLLFIGVDWYRKGGDVAVFACQELNRNGINAVLHIVGCNIPKRYKSLDCIKEYGFLSKNDPSQYKQFLKIIDKSDLFILPTKAEAAGIVFSEASAFGLPIFTYDTGGIGNYVINGVNGYRLPTNATGYDFALKIIESQGEFLRLKEGCLAYYQSNLNWRIWAEKFEKIIKKVFYEETKY